MVLDSGCIPGYTFSINQTTAADRGGFFIAPFFLPLSGRIWMVTLPGGRTCCNDRVPSDAPSPALLALDIGGTSIRAAVVQQGRIVERREARTPKPSTPDAVIGAALALAAPLAPAAAPWAWPVRARWPRARHRHRRPHLPRLDRRAPGPGRPRGAGAAVSVLNDARAAAWGESVAGAGQGTREFMFVTVSTGVGAGLVLGGGCIWRATAWTPNSGSSACPPPGETARRSRRWAGWARWNSRRAAPRWGSGPGHWA